MDLPPGKWWRRPEVIQMLSLTDEQQNRIEAISVKAANELIDLRGEVEKSNIALRAELDQPQLNREAIRRTAVHLNEARGRLFERELMMLVDMRSVLTDAQWNRMRQTLERLPERQMQQRQNRRRQQ
jgi:Spy/CpxP family protein refolding chaperone